MSAQKKWTSKSYPEEAAKNLAKRVLREWEAFQDRTEMTQTELAEKLGITQSAFNQFIRGVKPINIPILLNICNEIDTNPWAMVRGNSFYERRLIQLEKSLVKKPKQLDDEASYSVSANDLKKIHDVLAIPDSIRSMLPQYTLAELVVSIITKKIP